MLSAHDLILAFGAPTLRQYPFEEGPFVQNGTTIAVINDGGAIIESSRADIAVLGTMSDICA